MGSENTVAHLSRAFKEKLRKHMIDEPKVVRRTSLLFYAELRHMYDSNTSREPTASYRRGQTRPQEGILRHAPIGGKTPRRSGLPKCLARYAQNGPLSCTQKRPQQGTESEQEFCLGNALRIPISLISAL